MTICLVYGGVSETERKWVINEGLDILRWLKIQSIPLGKLKGIRVLIPIRQLIWVATHLFLNSIELIIIEKIDYHYFVIMIINNE